MSLPVRVAGSLSSVMEVCEFRRNLSITEARHPALHGPPRNRDGEVFPPRVSQDIRAYLRSSVSFSRGKTPTRPAMTWSVSVCNHLTDRMLFCSSPELVSVRTGEEGDYFMHTALF